MQPLQICFGPTIRIGRESWCLPYAGFLQMYMLQDWDIVIVNSQGFTNSRHVLGRGNLVLDPEFVNPMVL